MRKAKYNPISWSFSGDQMTHNQHAESSRNIHIYYSHFTYKIFYPLVAQLERTRLQCRRLQFDSWVRKSPWRRHWLPTPVFLGFPVGSAGKESACNVGDLGSIPGLVRSLEKQTAAYSSILAWRIPWIVHGVTKSWAQLSHFHFAQP